MLRFDVSFCEGEGRAEAYRVLERLLCAHFGEEGTAIAKKLYKDENGKPRLPVDSGMFVSISHTRNFGAAAIANAPVGIDVEELSPLDERKKALLERFFGNEDISSAKADPTGREFYRFWTRREAAFKAFADKPFYTADPVLGNETKIKTYFSAESGREAVYSIAK